MCKVFHQFAINNSTCSLCKRTFVDRRTLYIHLKLSHPEIIVKNGKPCYICLTEISFLSYWQHVKVCQKLFEFVEKSGEKWKCKICPTIRQKQQYIYTHVKKQHYREKDDPHKRKLDDSKKFNVSKRSEFTKKCKYCSDFFGTSAMSNHVKFCAKYGKFYKIQDSHFLCLKCGTTSSSRIALTKHMYMKHARDKDIERNTECFDEDYALPEQIEIEENKGTYENSTDIKIESIEGNVILPEAISIKDETQDSENNEMIIEINIEEEREASELVINKELPNINELEDSKTIEINNEHFEDDLDIKTEEKTKASEIVVKSELGYTNKKSKKGSKIVEIFMKNLRIPCNFCGLEIDQKVLDRHIKSCKQYHNLFKIDHQTKYFICLTCDRSFTRRRNIIQHLKIMHSEKVMAKSLSDISVNSEHMIFEPNINIETQEIGIVTQENEIVTQENEIVTKENEIETREKEIETQENEIVKQENGIETQEKMIETQKNKVETQEKVLETQEKEIKTQEKEVETKEGLNEVEPQELTKIFKCQMCLRKYVSYRDVEVHIQIFHQIPIKIQKNMSDIIQEQNIKETE